MSLGRYGEGVRDGNKGVRGVFKDAEPASLADRIIEKWKEYNGSPGEYAARVAKCRSFVEQGYTWQHHLKALELTYEKLLADPKN